MKRIVFQDNCYVPMTLEEQHICELALKRIASGNTKTEDIQELRMDRTCKRWKPSHEITRALNASPRIVYRETDNEVIVIHMESRTNEIYRAVQRKLRDQKWSK